jgi:hypothetical protein
MLPAAEVGTMTIAEAAPRSATAAAWGRTALLAGCISAGGVVLQTALFFLDASGVLPISPAYRETGAGRGEDLGAYYVAWFERQHDIVWDIAVRDTVGPIGAIALMVLALALIRLRGQAGAGVQVWALVFSVGALLKLLSDVVYLSELGVWLDSRFTAEFPADIVAVGRTAEAVDNLSSYLEAVAYVTLAAALVGLARALSRRLGVLARTVAGALVVVVIGWLGGWWPVYAVGAVLSGIVLAPWLLLATGRWLARSASSGLATPVQ